jgi:hypothetical protein
MLERIMCPPLMSPLGRHPVCRTIVIYCLLVGVDLIEWFGAESAVSGSAAPCAKQVKSRVYRECVIIIILPRTTDGHACQQHRPRA